MTSATETPNGNAVTMVVLDLGKKKRRDVKRLRKGRGRLMERVAETLADLKDDGTIAATGQAVIVVVRERPRRKGLRLF